MKIIKSNFTKKNNYYCFVFVGHAKIVELLAPAAVDANAPAPDGYTPTQLAARYGHVEVTKFFVSIVDNPNEPDFLGLSPVKSAINRGHWEVVKVNIFISFICLMIFSKKILSIFKF